MLVKVKFFVVLKCRKSKVFTKMWAVFAIFASQRHGYQTIKVVAITNTHRTIDYII